MKKIIFILFTISCISLFSRDWEISRGEIILASSQEYFEYNFRYDSHGEKEKFGFSVTSIETVCRIEYGIFDRFLIGALSNYGDFDFGEIDPDDEEIEGDGDDFEGFYQPEIYIDYVSKYGPGIYLGVILPYGMKQYPGSDTDPKYEFGFTFRPSIKYFRLKSGVSYIYSVKGRNDLKQDEINFEILPQVKINNVCTISAGIWGSYYPDGILDGPSSERSDAYVVYGDLGISYLSNDSMELGFSYEFPFLGENYFPAGAGFTLSLAYHL